MRGHLGHEESPDTLPPGLPARLPEGETLLWQGRPEWRALARSAFHTRKVAIYFGLLIAWWIADGAASGETGSAILSDVGSLALAASGSTGILSALAWLYAQGTVYSLTTKRLMIRSGLALPITVNLPLVEIETAALTRSPRGTGGLAFKLVKPNRIALLALWPHVRPLTFNNPEPMLRCLANADDVARQVAGALAATGGAIVQLPSAAQSQPNGLPSGASLAA